MDVKMIWDVLFKDSEGASRRTTRYGMALPLYFQLVTIENCATSPWFSKSKLSCCLIILPPSQTFLKVIKTVTGQELTVTAAKASNNIC